MSGPLPISLTDIVAYGGLIGYTDQADILFLVDIVKACDSVYLKKHYDEQKVVSAQEKVRSSGMRHK